LVNLEKYTSNTEELLRSETGREIALSVANIERSNFNKVPLMSGAILNKQTKER